MICVQQLSSALKQEQTYDEEYYDDEEEEAEYGEQQVPIVSEFCAG